MSDLMPRLVATDLDGTLVRSDGTISARTTEAIARVEAAGATLVMVTGRPPRWMHDTAAAVDHHGVAICANGAVVYDLHTETIVRTHLIEPAALAEAVERLREVQPGFRFAAEYATGFVYEVNYHLGHWDSASKLGGEAVDTATLVGTGATKLLAFDSAGDPDVLAAKAVEAVGHLVNVTHSSKHGLLEMSARGVTKASGLAALCDELGIKAAEVVAFGDMPNDLPMLAWAGTSYAVANAHPDVLAAVTCRTASNDDDGVAQVLERLFP